MSLFQKIFGDKKKFIGAVAEKNEEQKGLFQEFYEHPEKFSGNLRSEVLVENKIPDDVFLARGGAGNEDAEFTTKELLAHREEILSDAYTYTMSTAYMSGLKELGPGKDRSKNRSDRFNYRKRAVKTMRKNGHYPR